MTPKLEIEPGSSTAYHTGDWRSQQPRYQNKWPPCSETCPASEDIQAWLALTAEQHWQAAWRKLCERNPFPATMGRICYHACELACNRNHLDSAVNIHALERYLGDMAIARGWSHQRLCDKPQTQRIAIVGAGPAGLSCAFQLARHGYPVTIFDAGAAPGGTLLSGIPHYRLPKPVLASEIDAILALGIELRLNSRVGKEVSEDELRETFDAVFLAIGTQQPRRYPHADHSNHSLMSGLEFLHRLNRGEQFSLPKQVAVIGGGNTAIDVARCVRRLGTEATVICAHDPHGRHHRELGTEMPASVQEVVEAEAEGVQLIYRAGVRRLVRSGEHLSGIEIAHVDQLHDRHGNFNPILFSGTEAFVAAGLAIFAIGQAVDWQGLENLSQTTEEEGVWIGGDAAGKPKLAATAVGSGYQAAMSIMANLRSVPFGLDEHKKSKVSFRDMQLHYYAKQPRHEGEVNEQQPGDFSEVVSGLADAVAVPEAKRCLSCGVCFECDNCWHFCPDAAVIKNETAYEIDYDYCKGCGICAQECPCGHIDMEAV
ncbi:MAG TPA: FAD-dependent oxidoreductase [Candidatus Tenderia electrophaga]|uniref:FAD-dependent oxidoreductase n=1 Tax=Candidatus Tenderia electrophaga TaxID=1748243 RepID=A0A832JA63_9GAMM|nr:FAD-dependent oxidoreductase [Candidatus Tenderia electrophaga]